MYLIKLYGNGYDRFLERPQLGPIPLLGGLGNATLLYHHFNKIQSYRYNQKVPPNVFEELWTTFVESNEWKESRVIGSFHKTAEERQKLASKNMTLRQIRIEESSKSLEWLQEHGTCADNMQAGVSTIRQAGRGTFATRMIAKDSIVAKLPLLHVSDKSILEMYAPRTMKRREKKLLGYQLLLNYCFGHHQSTLLLCPFAAMMSFVNHNQTRANARLRWSKPYQWTHMPELLQHPIEQFARNGTAKLAMDLVALRDILPGEEIFLDYGDLWERAWSHHVKEFQPGAHTTNYISASQLNAATSRLRTESEQLHNPYPGNVELKCDVRIFRVMNSTLFENEGKVEIVRHWARNWLPCEVLSFQEVNGTLGYTALAKFPQKIVATESTTPAIKGKAKASLQHKGRMTHAERKMLYDAPREAFVFVDLPNTSDMFLRNAFRHPIMIPDDLFPDLWKNAKH